MKRCAVFQRSLPMQRRCCCDESLGIVNTIGHPAESPVRRNVPRVRKTGYDKGTRGTKCGCRGTILSSIDLLCMVCISKVYRVRLASIARGTDGLPLNPSLYYVCVRFIYCM